MWQRGVECVIDMPAQGPKETPHPATDQETLIAEPVPAGSEKPETRRVQLAILNGNIATSLEIAGIDEEDED